MQFKSCSINLLVLVTCAAFVAELRAEVRAIDLVNAPVEQLKQDHLAASNVKAALKQLISDDVSKTDSSAKNTESKQQRTKRTAVSVAAKPRAHETSVGKVPSALAPSATSKSFARIREQLVETPHNSAILEQLEKYVERFSNHREARLLLGRGQILSGSVEAALQTLEPLLASGESDWQAWFWTGSAYLAQGQADLAQQHLEVALDMRGDASDLWVQVAVLEQEQGRHASAIQYLDVAAQLNPDQAELHLNKAYSHEHLGEYERALASYRQFLVSEQSQHTQTLRSRIMRRIATLSLNLGQARTATNNRNQAHPGR